MRLASSDFRKRVHGIHGTSTLGPRAAQLGLEAPWTAAGWVPVLERHPEGLAALPGYIWLDMPGKVRSVGAHELEFTDDPPVDERR